MDKDLKEILNDVKRAADYFGAYVGFLSKWAEKPGCVTHGYMTIKQPIDKVAA